MNVKADVATASVIATTSRTAIIVVIALRPAIYLTKKDHYKDISSLLVP
jgi:hypothetical protein